MTEGVLKIRDAEIDFLCFGQGEKPLVIIPGLSLWGLRGLGGSMSRTYKCFEKDFRVFCIDKRRHISGDISIAELSEDYADAMKALNIDNACILGISQGGMIAQTLAVTHPELVEKLLLGVTTARSNETTAETVKTWIKLVENDDLAALLRDIILRTYSDEYIRRHSRLFDTNVRLSIPSDKERFIALAKACMSCEVYDRLDAICCPVYVVGAENDRVVTAQASRDIAEKLGCPLYIYENYGHAVYEEAKDFNTKALEFFLSAP